MRGPYHLATKGMSPRERAAWFRCHWIPAESRDPSVPSRFICQGAPGPNRQLRLVPIDDGKLIDVRFGEYYHQADYHGGVRLA
jgi:hypothetical protein